MPRQIPADLVQRYIKLDDKIDALAEERNELKQKLRSYNDRGYESPLLRFQPATTYRPDWKKLVTELTTKFMLPAKRRLYFRNLMTRFPRKPVAPTIVILSKEKKEVEV